MDTEFSNNVFSAIYTALRDALDGIVVANYTALIDFVDGPLQAAIAIYIILLGYAVMRGAIQYPFREVVYRALLLTLLYGLATNLYGAWIADLIITGAPDELAGAIGGGDVDSAGEFFDLLLARGFEVADQISAQADVEAENDGQFINVGLTMKSAFLIILVLISAIVCSAIGFVVLVFSIFALALLAIVGPIFVALLIFDSTRSFFFGWLGQVMNFLMLLLFALILTVIVVSVSETVMATALSIEDVTASAATAMAFYVIAGFFFFQIPTIAAGVAGSVAGGFTRFASSIATGGWKLGSPISRGGARAVGATAGGAYSGARYGLNRYRNRAGSVERGS